MRYAICMLIIVVRLFASGQSKIVNVDTVNIYKSKAGIRFSIYKREWFPKEKSYSYSPNKMTAQDSFVMSDSEIAQAFYYKVFKRKKRLLFEGLRPSYTNELRGDIRFYYASGKIKRIEHWDDKAFRVDSCMDSVGLDDDSQKEGIWKYYKRNGRLKKIVEYKITSTSCNPATGCKIAITKYYNRKGNVKSTKQKRLECF